MRRDLVPYYISRAVLSAAMGWFLSRGVNPWLAALVGLLMFVGFLWYAHSGWYLVDTSNPLFPLRRDDRGNIIRNRAVVTSVAIAAFCYMGLSLAGNLLPAGLQTGSLAFAVGVLSYFAISVYMFVRG